MTAGCLRLVVSCACFLGPCCGVVDFLWGYFVFFSVVVCAQNGFLLLSLFCHCLFLFLLLLLFLFWVVPDCICAWLSLIAPAGCACWLCLIVPAG